MLKDVNFSANTNISKDDMRIKSSDSARRPSFRGNPNGVDNTPANDTYTRNEVPPPHEEGFGQKFMKYIIPTWLSLHFGTELFNKANGGAYEKSLVGRLGRFGDWLSGTKLVDNSFVRGMKTHGSSLKGKAKNYVMNHEKLRAMYETPTAPESSMVTNFMETQAEADLKEAAGKIDKFVEKNPKSLKELGATKAEIQTLQTKYGKGLFGGVKNEAGAIEEYLLTKMGADLGHKDIMKTITRGETGLTNQIQQLENRLAAGGLTEAGEEAIRNRIARLTELKSSYKARVLKNLKLRTMGLNANTYDLLKNNPTANPGVLERALGKLKGYVPKFSQSYNKVKSIGTPTTRLGKLFPKMAKLGMRGLTFGGGLFNSLFVAFFLGDAVKNTIDAPKDKKTGTFVHGLLDAMSWVVAMPLAIKGMHAVNGLKNLGKTKTQVETYKNALKTFNESVKAGALRDPNAYNQAFARLQTLKNAGTAPKGFSKVLSKVASFLSVGLEQPARYKEATQKIGFLGSNIKNWIKPDNLAAVGRNLKRNLPNIGKNVLGYPLRFALYMFVFAPVVDKAFSAIASALFGKPYDPEKHKEQYEKQEMRKQMLYPGPSIMPNPEAVKGLDNLDVNTLSDNNLVKQELIKKGLAQPNKKHAENNPTTQQKPQWDSVNGISVTTKNDAEPFMPPNYQQPGQGQKPNGYNTNDQKDPNISDYDTVPRSYEPQINWENPIPYQDTTDYNRANELLERSDKVAKDLEEYFKK